MTGHSKQKKHSDRKHSNFSPSSAERWFECPACIRLSKTVPKPSESIYATEGTTAHECLEFLLIRVGNLKKAKLLASKKYDLEMIEHALTAIDKIMSLKPCDGAELLVESRVRLKSCPNVYGTLDVAWIDLLGDLVVIDFKYGRGVTVLPFDENNNPNPQLAIYAVGLASKYHYEFERVRLAIIQPRVWENEDPLTVGDISIKKLKLFEKKLVEKVKLASTPNAPMKSGDHCRWCPALAVCPENSKKALKAVSVDFDFETGLQAVPKPSSLTGENLGKILQGCEQLELWIKAVKGHAFRIAELGETIPGYKLVAKRANRVWNSGADTKAKKLFGNDCFETKTVFLSPAQMEKKFGKQAKEFTAANTSAISSGSTLVSESNAKAELLNVNTFDFIE